MRGPGRALLVTVAAVSAVAAIYLVLTLPPRSIDLGGGYPALLAPGAIHIHTSRSDGTGTLDEIAAAAARVGLAYVVITDHGDGTRRPDPPTYRHGVLCIDAVEIGSDAGHVVALGLARETPFPLGGDPRDVVDDIHRFGGTAIVAHPDSPQRALSWRSGFQEVDGLEWMNIDAEWRDDPSSALLRSTFQSLFRAPESIGSLLDRPAATLQRWDGLLQSRKVVSLAALDAHARIGWRETDEPRGPTVLAWPGYRTMFRVASQVAVLTAPLTGDAVVDAAAVTEALTSGRSYSVIDAFARPASLSFTAEQAGRPIAMGGAFAADGGPVTFSAEVAQAPGATISLVDNGRRVTASGRVRHTVPTPGPAYRVEVELPGVAPGRGRGRGSRPWIVSNAIVRAGEESGAPTAAAPGPPVNFVPLVGEGGWSVEHDTASRGDVALDGGDVRLQFALGDGPPAGQYAALVSAGNRDVGADRVRFVARASQPMRISLQLRLPGGKGDLRWRRSVFVDTTPRVIVVRLQDLMPVGSTPTTRRPIVAPVESLLLVVDTVNTRPGTRGTLWIGEVSLGVGTTAESVEGGPIRF